MSIGIAVLLSVLCAGVVAVAVVPLAYAIVADNPRRRTRASAEPRTSPAAAGSRRTSGFRPAGTQA